MASHADSATGDALGAPPPQRCCLGLYQPEELDFFGESGGVTREDAGLTAVVAAIFQQRRTDAVQSVAGQELAAREVVVGHESPARVEGNVADYVSAKAQRGQNCKR